LGEQGILPLLVRLSYLSFAEGHDNDAMNIDRVALGATYDS
jgi:hypothetical protein